MSAIERRLRVVRTSPAEDEAASRDLDDVGLTLLLFLVAALPLASAVAGVGRWDEASLGAGTIGVLLAGRELCAWLLGGRRAGGRP